MSPRQENVFRILVLIASRAPVYVTIPVAVAAYFGFHAYVSDQAHLHGRIGQTASDAILTAIVFGAAEILQFGVPMLLGYGAALSLIASLKKQKLRKLARSASDTGVMAQLSWREFEQVVGQAFASRGYDVEFTPDGADGGVDIVLKRQDGTYLVQCKHWKANQVGVDVVRSLHGVMTKRRAAGGYIVTSGGFTRDARLYCEGENLWIINGEELRGLLAAGGAGTAGRLKLVPEPYLDPKATICPRCQSRMVLRLARRGANSGNRFWGCSNWPECDETRPLAV